MHVFQCKETLIQLSTAALHRPTSCQLGYPQGYKQTYLWQLIYAKEFLVNYLYRVAQKERMSLGPHAHQIYLPAISFFGVTSNQKSAFENLVQSTIWKFPFAKKLQFCHKKLLVNVKQNFEERLRTCVRQEGRHLSDIIFRNWVINVSNQNYIYYRLFWC